MYVMLAYQNVYKYNNNTMLVTDMYCFLKLDLLQRQDYIIIVNNEEEK